MTTADVVQGVMMRGYACALVLLLAATHATAQVHSKGHTHLVKILNTATALDSLPLLLTAQVSSHAL